MEIKVKWFSLFGVSVPIQQGGSRIGFQNCLSCGLGSRFGFVFSQDFGIGSVVDLLHSHQLQKVVKVSNLFLATQIIVIELSVETNF